ncbi:hypothetical protein J2790_002813 [Paenarthrobacter nicotinovorans]|nr:hypothetical protein [Paenarthrobacter nicotinovorans]
MDWQGEAGPGTGRPPTYFFEAVKPQSGGSVE